MNYAAILTRVDVAGVYHMPVGGEADLVAAAMQNGYRVFRVDLSAAEDKESMFSALAKAMKFPSWFGFNWDGLLDCLADLSWEPGEGYVVILERCDRVHGLAEADFVHLLQVFEAAAQEWREQGVPFWCFVDMQADGISWLADIA
ncbi:MAG: barstar family protein [Rhodocyclaceae bacterium]|nr:barstar family protein [Rhodocyclaceae bacterium]